MESPFSSFLETFIPKVAKKSKQHKQALWLLETTGAKDAASLTAELGAELSLLFHDKKAYEDLLSWEKKGECVDPVLKRELTILLLAFKKNSMSPSLLEELSKREAHLSQSYALFRPQFEGKALSENGIREILKKEKNLSKRKGVWEASKEIGSLLAPQILEIVRLRNQGAKELGYSDYFQMQLSLQEVEEKKLFSCFDELSSRSSSAYKKVLQEVEEKQKKMFSTQEIGPWLWSEPFCQEDPLDTSDLDELVEGVDFLQVARKFFERLSFSIDPILENSDLYEREGKSQHAFCISIDRGKDIRTLNNLRPSIRWLETLLHELGHAVYDDGFSPDLPWLLRRPPHMIPTEAMALICGRHAYLSDSLRFLIPGKSEELMGKAENSLKRRQLIFSRWVFVMSYFERDLYKNPQQDLNALWWKYVEKFQGISPPSNRRGKHDWAAKYHIGQAPVYYFSYLLGELFASDLQEVISKGKVLDSPEKGELLKEKLFAPGSLFRWDQLIEKVIGRPLSVDSWLKAFS